MMYIRVAMKEPLLVPVDIVLQLRRILSSALPCIKLLLHRQVL